MRGHIPISMAGNEERVEYILVTTTSECTVLVDG